MDLNRAGYAAVAILLAAIALVLGIALRPLAVDDAFVTFRYAHNLATGVGFTYNTGQPVLSTTSPLYALILAAGARAWPGALGHAAPGPGLPALANACSALALWAGALLILALGRRGGTPWAGILAAGLWILSPLLWLSLGLETAVFLALALGAVVAYHGGHLYRMATLLALATLTRGDALILAAVLGADYGFRWLVGRAAAGRSPAADAGRAQSTQFAWRRALAAVAVYLVVLVPVLAWLAWQFGSPLPVTLRAKVAQAELGITGFYPHTTYLQGLGILLRARLAQTPLYLLFVPALLAGLAAVPRRGRWVGLLTAWGAAHLAGYTLLGVTPYYWYYAPMVPGLVSLTALGVVESARWLGRTRLGQVGSWGVGSLWSAALLLTFLLSDWAMVQALHGPVPRPEDPVSKVLPEAKTGVYRQAGEWLRDHTPPEAVVGVTEVGVMGYYAGRTMVDFLGLLEPEVAEALRRGDLYWALLRYQPDYLALTAVSPLYAYDLRADPWFQAAYTPVQTIADPRFWGSPLTIYQRRLPRVPLAGSAAGSQPEGATRLDVDMGPIRLLGAVAGGTSVVPGDVVPITLYWQAVEPVSQDYTVFVHLLGQHDRVLAQRDAVPGLGARPTSQWRPGHGQVVIDPYLLALPEAAYAPDQAVWEVGLYDARTGQRLQTAQGPDSVRFGQVSVLPRTAPLHLDFGPAALTGYQVDRLALSPGEVLHAVLNWTPGSDGAAPLQVTVQLVGEAGNVGAYASRRLEALPAGGDAYDLLLEPGSPPGAYDLELLVADPATDQQLPLLGADGQPQADRARLTKIRLYP